MRDTCPETVQEKARTKTANMWLLSSAIVLLLLALYVLFNVLLSLPSRQVIVPDLVVRPDRWHLVALAGTHMDWLLRYVFLFVSFLPLLGAFLISRSRLLQVWGGFLSLLLMLIWVWWG
ncbi:MAG: hypothetical protein ACOY81_00250 [Bacillota bacterium]|uniref:hypothetical protein n=1 Tax=Desulfurispora thermophila TaxID=265470 RepID=UPI00036FB13F|nr:hypothetical protein [Desulfurispora thermophila]